MVRSEEIINELCEADVLLSQGQAVKRLSVQEQEQAHYRWRRGASRNGLTGFRWKGHRDVGT